MVQTASNHPLLPPTTEEDRLSWLRLLRSRRVGVATFYRLMAEYGTAQAALEALPKIAHDAGVQDYHPCPVEVAKAELAAGKRIGARPLFIHSQEYSRELSTLYDAPPIMWMRGDINLLNRPMIALVGARNASSLGTRMARKLAQELGEKGFVVVSGLARGIDAAAHSAALDTGTVAVMAGGVDVIYPTENGALADQIRDKGAIVSEQPIGLNPMARHFPTRNRIISGLAQAVVVVEAAAKSGSLITARGALDQGREVLAVPGHPFDARASGCNMLIRDGARLVRSADDVIEALSSMAPKQPLPPTAPAPTKRTLKETAKLHQLILDRLGPSPVAEDQLIRDIGAPASQFSSVMVDLELDGQIARQPGGLICKTV